MEGKSLRGNIGMIVFCLVINAAGKLIAASFNLPIWFDVVGTCVAAYFTGPVGAIAAGIAGNLLYSVLMQSEWCW